MKGHCKVWVAVLLVLPFMARSALVHEVTSAYHHIQVIDRGGVRTLSFDGTEETRMSLRNPLEGHFQYTESFHMPWLWNREIKSVLMIGLGGGSTQRSFEHYYPGVRIETAEIDPMVLRVAREYFELEVSSTQRVHIADGRVFLRRDTRRFDLIVLDAYSENRYGSFLPYHLTTKEFFELARERLTTNGVLAYNVIGNLEGWRADIVGSMYRTMKEVFPQVYFFPAQDSLNVVMVATVEKALLGKPALQQRANELIRTKKVTLPTFQQRLSVVRTNAPPSFRNSKVLTDDFAPVDNLLQRGR